MFISPSTCHLAPGSLGCALRPQRLGVSALFPQASRLPRAFDFFPRGPQAGYWAQLGTERLPNQGLSRLLLNTPLPGPTGGPSFRHGSPRPPALCLGSRAPARSPQGAQARRVGEGKGGGVAAGGMEESPAAGRRCAEVPAARCAPRPARPAVRGRGAVMMRRTAETPAP